MKKIFFLSTEIFFIAGVVFLFLAPSAWAAPDIIIRNITGSGASESGQTMNFSAEAYNQGTGMDTSNSYRLEKIGGPAGTTPYQNIITTSGNYAYITGSDGSGLTDSFEIFDITNPTNPFKVSGFDKHTHGEGGIIVSGDLEYTAHGTCDPALEIWNVSNRLSPFLIGRNVGCIGGAAIGITMSYPYVYLNRFTSQGLSVYNVSNPAAPILAGSAGSSFPSGTAIGRGIASKGNYVYVVGSRWNGYTGGFIETYDVSNPAAPVSVGQIISSDTFMYAKVSGNYLYLGHYSSLGVSIFDISNPVSPVRVAIASSGSQVNPDISGQYLYAGNKVFNIINPASPTPVQQRSVSDIIGISVSINYAYGLSSGSSGSLSVYEPHTFSRICIDNPNCLTSTTGRIGGADFDAGKLGASAFKAVSASWTATAGNHTVYFCSDVKNTSGYDGVAESNENNNCSSYTFTINVPPKPDLITQNINIAGTLETGQVITFSADVKNQGVGMSTANSYQLVRVGSDPVGGLNDSDSPLIIAEPYAYTSDREGVLWDMRVKTRTYYVGDPNNIHQVDIKIYNTNIGGPKYVNDMIISGNILYVGNYLGDVGENGDLMIYNISNRAAPVFLGKYAIAGMAVEDMALYKNRYIIAIAQQYGSPIIDVSNPANPVKVSDLLYRATGGTDNPYRVAVFGDYAYVLQASDSTQDLTVYNISNPANPVAVGGRDLHVDSSVSRYPTFAIVRGLYLYVGYNTSLYILDLSNPQVPALVRTINLVSYVYDITFSGNYMYAQNAGVYDVTNPAAPVKVNASALGGGTYAVEMDPKYLYATEFLSGSARISMAEPHVFSRICLDNPNCQTTTTGRLGGGDFDNGSLVANTSKAISAASTVSAGTHTVYFCSDIKDTNGYYGVAEENETNNCASSTFTVIQKYNLTVTKAGAGSGTVTSNPAGISCGADCSESYPSGTSVTLTATPDAGSVFSSWSGCTTSSGNTCTVSMTYSRGVTATFIAKTLNVSLSASPASGSSPLSSTLTATVSGTAVGTINYTFYCNRNDAGTNVTLPYDGKYDGQAPTTKSHTCVYSTSGTFYPKVIVERDVVAAATDVKTITVAAGTKTYTCSAKPATGTSWNTVSSYSQTWNGSAWSPADSTTTYNATADTNSCRYTCATDYIWDGLICVFDNNCEAITSECTQCWNNAAWIDGTVSCGTACQDGVCAVDNGCAAVTPIGEICWNSYMWVNGTYNTPPEVSGLTALNWSYADARVNALGAKLQFNFVDPDSGSYGSAYQVVVKKADNTYEVLNTGICTAYNTPSADCKIDNANCMKNDAIGCINPGDCVCSYAIDQSKLAYGISYKWWVQVWDDKDEASAVANYNTNPDTDNNDGVILTFTTYKHEFPKPSATYFPANPSREEGVKFTDTSKTYLTAAPTVQIPCDAVKCSWFWTVPGDATIDDPATSTPTITFNNAGSNSVTLKVTDNFDGYYSEITIPVGINAELPKWQEVKPE